VIQQIRRWPKCEGSAATSRHGPARTAARSSPHDPSPLSTVVGRRSASEDRLPTVEPRRQRSRHGVIVRCVPDPETAVAVRTPFGATSRVPRADSGHTTCPSGPCTSSRSPMMVRQAISYLSSYSAKASPRRDRVRPPTPRHRMERSRARVPRRQILAGESALTSQTVIRNYSQENANAFDQSRHHPGHLDRREAAAITDGITGRFVGSHMSPPRHVPPWRKPPSAVDADPEGIERRNSRSTHSSDVVHLMAMVVCKA
jgi:hypothetical protein